MAKRRGNNEGSVFQRTTGQWTAMVSIEGKRLTKYFKTQREAREWIKKTRDQIDAGMSLAGAQATVAEYMQDWLTTARTTIRPKTYEQYFQVVNQHIIPILGKIKLAELRPDNIQALYNGKLRGGTSARTVCIIHRALHIALRLGLVVRNAADAVTKPKYTKKEMKVLDDVQVRNFLLAAQGTGYEAFFQLEVTTGLRLGEMFGLKWADLDWSTRKLQIRRQVYRVKGQGLVFAEVKTKASRRNVIIGNATLRKIQEHYDNQQILRQTVGDKWHDLDLIFPNSVGNPMEHANLLKIFKEGLRKAGLPDMRFHDLRHTAATLMLINGTNPKIVQERLGHSDISMTLNTYSHVLPSMQDEAAEKLDELITMVEVGVELPKMVQPAVSPFRQNNHR